LRQVPRTASLAQPTTGAFTPADNRWSLCVGAPFAHANVTWSWVAPVVQADGTAAVLKLGMPHMEGADEIRGFRFWNGDPTVQLLEADDQLGAMLLERCQPGDMLRSEPEEKWDLVIATLVKRLWRKPGQDDLPHFRHLSVMLKSWSQETLAQADHWPDTGLVKHGLQLFQELSRPSPEDRLLATDLHAANVLRSDREPWLVIDPKPFIGEVAFDLVLNTRAVMSRPSQLFICSERAIAGPRDKCLGFECLFRASI
jgi:streptomycin 6-kinase